MRSTRSQGFRCQVSGVRCQVSGVRKKKHISQDVNLSLTPVGTFTSEKSELPNRRMSNYKLRRK